MPTYIGLVNWTDQGIRNVKESPKRVDAAKALAAKVGGKLDVWFTMGKWDFVGFADAPSDEAYMQIALAIGAQGNARTTSLKAWSVEEGAKVIAKL